MLTEYGVIRLAPRLGRRRAGPGPEPRPRPLALPPPPDRLLFLMRSSRDMSKALDMLEPTSKRSWRSWGEERGKIGFSARKKILAQRRGVWRFEKRLLGRVKITRMKRWLVLSLNIYVLSLKNIWCRGVVGYHVSLTHWRSPVQVRATPILWSYFAHN